MLGARAETRHLPPRRRPYTSHAPRMCESRVTHHQRIPLVLNSLVNHHSSPPSSTTHPVSCGFASPDPVSTSPPPLPLSELQCKSFPFEKNKKKKNCISIEFALDYRSLRANKGHPASVFIVTLYIRVNLTSVPRSISVEAILFSPTKRSEVCSVFRSRNFEIRKIQRVR